MSIFVLDMAKESLGNKDKERLAFDLYCNTDKSQKDICEIVGWSEKTFTAHKLKGNWEELKSASSITAQKIIRNLYQRLHDLTVEGKVLDADKIIKLANTIEKLSDRRTSISNVMNVFKEFTSWLMERDSELAKAVNEQQKAFIDWKINER